MINCSQTNNRPAQVRLATVLWALGDILGTIRDIADLSGSTTSVTTIVGSETVVDLVSESNSLFDMVFAYTGKIYDENTHLQNNVFRWYDGATGQWMSEDPLGFVAGDENLRRYVKNAKRRQIGPLGLQDPNEVREPLSDDLLRKLIRELNMDNPGSESIRYCRLAGSRVRRTLPG